MELASKIELMERLQLLREGDCDRLETRKEAVDVRKNGGLQI